MSLPPMELRDSAPLGAPDEGGWADLVENLSGRGGTTALDDPTLWEAGGLSRLTVDVAGNELHAQGPFVQRVAAAGALGPNARTPAESIRLLSERADFIGQRGRPGVVPQSVGGSAWIVAALDGWFCLNLARWDDAASLPALFGSAVDHRDWDGLRSACGKRPVAELDEQAELLGLPAGRIPTMPLGSGASDDPQILYRHGGQIRSPFLVTDFGVSMPAEKPLVIDLTSLWAGPLCGALLAEAGCRVIKVEGTRRPDGARSGPEPFFNALNGTKEMLSLDFDEESDRRLLRRLLASADLVLEGSRPRVMDALGIDPYQFVAEHGMGWVALTAFGRTGPWSNRVGFGDDVAAQAGVVSRFDRTGATPRFVGDALADPVGGLFAAAVAWHAISHRRAAVIDVALREALAFAWRDTTVVPFVTKGPRSRFARWSPRPAAKAGGLGADGDGIRAEFGLAF